MARGETEVQVINGEPVRFSDTAGVVDRFVTTAKATAELPDGTKGEGKSYRNDQREAEREALFDAYSKREAKR